MASITVSRSSSKACGVALGTYRGSMNASEWKVRGCVIKVSIQPVVRVVAHRAINRVLLGFMVFCSVILNLMTSDAIRWGVEYRSLVA